MPIKAKRTWCRSRESRRATSSAWRFLALFGSMELTMREIIAHLLNKNRKPGNIGDKYNA
jgi:hypothetical protein